MPDNGAGAMVRLNLTCGTEMYRLGEC
jgi:hypothetical protein